MEVFRNAKGEFLPPGSTLQLRRSKADGVIGYDGKVFLTNLGTRNLIKAKAEEGICHASFFPFT